MRIGVGLSIPELATRGGRFSPASLFTGGVQGAWYDPSDINNYTAQSGPELIVNGNFSNGTTGWSATNATLSAASNQLTITSTSNFGIGASTGFTTVVGRWYKASATLISCSAATARIRKTDSATNFNVGIAHLVNGIGWYSGQVFTIYFQATATTTYIMGVTDLNPSNITIANVSVVETISVANATLFQDSAGTTPVTAVEQPVGLMLDKSQGGLGPELVTNGGFSSSSNWTLSNTTITGGNLVFGVAFGYASQAISGTAGNYKLLVSKSAGFAGAGNLTFAFYNAGSMVGSAISIGSATLTFGSGIVTASGSFDEIRISCSTTDAYQVDSVSLARAPGNHASQATPTSCPVLRARYNQLTYSEQFDNAAWFAGSTTVSANQATAPDGTVTADLVYVATTGVSRYIWRNVSVFTASAQVITSSFYVKASSWTWVMVNGTGTNTGVWFNIATGQKGTESAGCTGTISDAGNGWWRCTVTETRTGTVQPTVFLCDANNSLTATASGTNGVYLWGAQLSYGSSAGTYQRIAAATDYATAGFLPYLYFVTDDSFGTNSIDFTATDKMAVVAGMTKLSDASVSIPFELSANHVANAGSFALYASAGALPNYEFRMTSTANAYRTATTYTAPITNVLSCAYDIAQSTVATEIVPKVNGATPTLVDSGSAGTGNFGNYPLFIGRRNNATFPFEGRIYQLIVCGKALSASELASTEAYVNSKTGAY